MTFSQLLTAQLADPFRIVLLIALVYTMQRNRAATGVVLPLVSGIIFVALIIPSTLGAGIDAPFWRQAASGVVANALITVVVLGVWETVRRMIKR